MASKRRAEENELIRKIKKNVETRRKFRKPWKMVVKNVSTSTMEELEMATSQFYANNLNFASDSDLDPGSKIDSESWCISPLHVAAGTGNISLWKTLEGKTKDTQPKDEAGQTPLHYAALNGHFEMYQLISGQLKDKNPRDHEDWTPFHCAAQAGHLHICKAIMETIAEKNPQTFEGITPLHEAAYTGHFDI